MMAEHVAGCTLVPAFLAVTVIEEASTPMPGEKVAQLPPADGSSVGLHVSLSNANVVEVLSCGVSVAVLLITVNSTDPAVVMLPLEHASVPEAQCTVTVSAPGTGVGLAVGVGLGVGLGVVVGVGDGLGVGFFVGVGDGLGVGFFVGIGVGLGEGDGEGEQAAQE